jgi:TMEM175 potassium channel family protein
MAGEPESLYIHEPLAGRIKRHDYDRLLMLSDGVFAIAITLLALELKLPERWDGSLGQLLGETGRPLVGYLFGFVLVGVFWFMHRRLFAQFEHVDRVVTFLNLLLLGLVGLTPYVARMIAEAGPTRALPFYLMAIGSVFAAVTLIQVWALMRPELLHPEVDRRSWLNDVLFHASSAIALGALGLWGVLAHRVVGTNAFVGMMAVLAIGQRLLKRASG